MGVEGCTLFCGNVSEKVSSSSKPNSNSIKIGIYSIKIIDIDQCELNRHLTYFPKRRYKDISVNK